ncbi:hypothetical protein EDC96DRAFT_78939 [Choanephora cucurbitarum]|nr:hypothetical protein EDC96DRAFT_78939 [Choanephora cucurbitarum]
MIPSRRIFALASTRYIHTTRAMMAESDGLFGKINPWAKKEQTPVQPTTTEEETKVTFNVDYEDAEEIVSLLKQLSSLSFNIIYHKLLKLVYL